MSKKKNPNRKPKKSNAEKQWEEIQVKAATAWHNLDIALELVEANKEELSEEDYQAIREQADRQQKMIQDLLIEGKNAFDASTGVLTFK